MSKYFHNKLCARAPEYAPALYKLTFDLLTLKVVSESCFPPSVWLHLFCGAGHEKRRGRAVEVVPDI